MPEVRADPTEPTQYPTRHKILTQKTQTCTQAAPLRRERDPMVKFIFLAFHLRIAKCTAAFSTVVNY